MSNYASARKRSAASQTGPASKKAYSGPSVAEKRRSQPVTRSFPIQEDADSDEEEEGFEEVPAAEEDVIMTDFVKLQKDPNSKIVQ